MMFSPGDVVCGASIDRLYNDGEKLDEAPRSPSPSAGRRTLGGLLHLWRLATVEPTTGPEGFRRNGTRPAVKLALRERYWPLRRRRPGRAGRATRLPSPSTPAPPLRLAADRQLERCWWSTPGTVQLGVNDTIQPPSRISSGCRCAPGRPTSWPLAVQEVALVEDQVSLVETPAVIDVGERERPVGGGEPLPADDREHGRGAGGAPCAVQLRA